MFARGMRKGKEKEKEDEGEEGREGGAGKGAAQWKPCQNILPHAWARMTERALWEKGIEHDKGRKEGRKARYQGQKEE